MLRPKLAEHFLRLVNALAFRSVSPIGLYKQALMTASSVACRHGVNGPSQLLAASAVHAGPVVAHGGEGGNRFELISPISRGDRWGISLAQWQ